MVHNRNHSQVQIYAWRLYQEKNVIYLFLFFLFFSNLLARVSGASVNIVFYLICGVLFLTSVRSVRLDIVTITNLFLIFLFTVYVFDARFSFSANVLSIKDFVIPLLCYFIGYRMSLYRREVVNLINVLFLPFVLYGLLQAGAFFTGRLDSVLPWDSAWILQLKSEGVTNLYQETLLRFFGVMNAFFEYQAYIVIIISFLWANVALIKNKGILFSNFIFSFIFIILALERTPILMFIILLPFTVYNYLSIKRSLYGILLFIMVLGAISFHIFIAEDKNNDIFSDAYHRLTNVFLLDFDADDSTAERKDILWKTSSELALTHVSGIGPGRVSPAAQHYEDAVQPHNNYLVYWLAYGFWGLVFMLLFLLLLFVKFILLDHNIKYFGIGLLICFCMLAMFNLPFAGKVGILFFLISGFILNTQNASARLNSP